MNLIDPLHLTVYAAIALLGIMIWRRVTRRRNVPAQEDNSQTAPQSDRPVFRAYWEIAVEKFSRYLIHPGTAVTDGEHSIFFDDGGNYVGYRDYAQNKKLSDYNCIFIATDLANAAYQCGGGSYEKVANASWRKREYVNPGLRH